MADSEIKRVVNQAALQAATVVIMVFRDIDTGLQLAKMQNQWETQRQRHGGLIQNVQDSYVKLLNFELEVTNMLETRAY